MKLFYKAGTCSLSPHIILNELNISYEIEAVDLGTKVMAQGGDYKQINPKGSVPALKLGNGEILTEGAVLVQYLADQNPELGLMGKIGTMERFRCMEWLNFIATDVHKTYSPFFGLIPKIKNAEVQNEVKTFYMDTLKSKISFISKELGPKNFLMGENFTAPDAYLFTVLSWSKLIGLDLSAWDNISHYMSRVAERPAVVKAMKAEGLIK